MPAPDRINNLIKTLKLEDSTDADVAAILSDGQVPEDTVIKYGTIGKVYGRNTSIGVRAVVNGMIEASTGTTKAAVQSFNAELDGDGLEIGLPDVREGINEMLPMVPAEHQPLLLLLLNHGKKRYIEEYDEDGNLIPITELDVKRARAIKAIEDAHRITEAEVSRIQENAYTKVMEALVTQRNAALTWDGEGSTPEWLPPDLINLRQIIDDLDSVRATRKPRRLIQHFS